MAFVAFVALLRHACEPPRRSISVSTLAVIDRLQLHQQYSNHEATGPSLAEAPLAL